MSQFNTVAGHGPVDQRSDNDFYPTPPLVTLALLQREKFPGPIWEPCAGNGHMVHALQIGGYDVVSSELHDYDFTPDCAGLDFTRADRVISAARSIVANPPYKSALPFVRKAVELGIEKHAWLLRFQFIEGHTERYQFFQDHPPIRIHVFSRRVQISERGITEGVRGGVIVFAWWIWERGYTGAPALHWIEPDAV